MSSWLDKIVPAGILTNLGNKDRQSNIPEGVWKKCPKCAAALYKPELEKEITILDISDVTDIQYLGQFSDPLLPNAPTPPRAHNPFIRADLLYISYSMMVSKCMIFRIRLCPK